MTAIATACPQVRQTPPFRADHVGSFLRPKKLLDAREQHKAGTLDAAALRAVEDDAIVVRLADDRSSRWPEFEQHALKPRERDELSCDGLPYNPAKDFTPVA